MQRLGLVLAIVMVLLNAACGTERQSTLAASDGSDEPLAGRAGDLCAQRKRTKSTSCADTGYECTALLTIGAVSGPVKAKSACSYAEARARLLEEICDDESLATEQVRVEDLSCVTTPRPS